MKSEKLSENVKLLTEWHYQRNGDLRPEDFAASSGRVVWWKCMSGHCWQAKISDRTKGFGCPYDCGKKTFNSDLHERF